MKKQRVIRTYPDNYTNPISCLKKALDEGWAVVLSNNFDCGREKGIEYIVEKEID